LKILSYIFDLFLAVGWRLFDDSIVSLISENQTVARSGYVLFYRRRNITVSLPPSVDESTDSSSTEEEDSQVQESEGKFNTKTDTPSSFLTSLSPLDNRFIGGSGDATTEDTSDNRYDVPSNSPSVYSFTDMDTVD
jgi:hypothetical protein